MKIAIIGAGWYGCHLTLFFQKLGYEVTLYEKNNKIFTGCLVIIQIDYIKASIILEAI